MTTEEAWEQSAKNRIDLEAKEIRESFEAWLKLNVQANELLNILKQTEANYRAKFAEEEVAKKKLGEVIKRHGTSEFTILLYDKTYYVKKDSSYEMPYVTQISTF